MEKERVGKAYAFFDCKAIKEEIESEISFIRELVQTPNELELSLQDGEFELEGNSELLRIAQEAKVANTKYLMGATYSGATNRKTADELSAILNQAYLSPLYEKGENFRGKIFYEENGSYTYRKNFMNLFG